MGAYIIISESDRVMMSRVQDQEVNDLLREARMHDPQLLMEEDIYKVRKGLFKKVKESRFSVYHESPAFDGSAYQARLSFSGSGSKEVVTAYLTGIINGALAQNRYVGNL